MTLVARTFAWTFLVALAWRTVWPSDVGWQIAAGRWIAAHGPPATDALSYIARGLPWIEPRWLWCTLVAALWDGPGPWAVSLVAAVLHVAAFAIAWRTAGARDGSPTHAAFLVLTALAASQRLVARPEAVTYVAFAGMVALLERDRRAPTPWVFACAGIQALWINMHTMAFLGPVVCALALVTAPREQIKRAGLVLALVVLATFASPYATALPSFAMQLLAESRDAELRAWIPELASAWGPGGGPLARGAFALLVVAVPVWLLATRRRPSRFLLLLWIVAVVLASGSVRHLPLAALASLALSGTPTREVRARKPARTQNAPARSSLGRTFAHGAIGAVALFGVWLVATQRFHVLQHDTSRFGLGETPHRYPRAAMRFVAGLRDEAGRTPRTFASPLASSTGLAEGVPSHTDLRTEVFGSARLARTRAALASRESFDRLASEDSVSVAVADLDAPAFVHLILGHPGWHPVYLDENALVSVRAGAGIGARALRRGDVDSLAAFVRSHLPAVPASLWSGPARAVPAATPYHRFGNALVSCGRPDLAIPFFHDAARAEPHSATAHGALGLALAATGDTASAVRALREAVRVDPRNTAIRDALSRLAR